MIYVNWFVIYNWKPPNLSELTTYQVSSGLTHLGSEASNCIMKLARRLMVKKILKSQAI